MYSKQDVNSSNINNVTRNPLSLQISRPWSWQMFYALLKEFRFLLGEQTICNRWVMAEYRLSAMISEYQWCFSKLKLDGHLGITKLTSLKLRSIQYLHFFFSARRVTIRRVNWWTFYPYGAPCGNRPKEETNTSFTEVLFLLLHSTTWTTWFLKSLALDDATTSRLNMLATELFGLWGEKSLSKLSKL